MIGKKYKPKREEQCFEQVILCLLFQVGNLDFILLSSLSHLPNS